MAKKEKTRSLELSTAGTAVVVFLLAALRLSELIPITRTAAGSPQNWRIDIYASVLTLICGIWIFQNRALAADKFGGLGKNVSLIFYFLIGFTLWGALSVFWAHSWASVLLHTLMWIVYIAVFAYALVLIRMKNGLSGIIKAFMAASAVAAVVCLVDYYLVDEPGKDFGLIRMKYSRFAECFVTLSPVLCVWALYVRKRPLVVASVAAWLSSWLVVLLSISKGAFLAGIIGHVFLFAGCILLTRYPIRRKMAILAAVWLAFTVFVQIAQTTLSPLPTTTEHWSTTADPAEDTTVMRIFTWKVGSLMAAAHPILGVGANNFGANFNPFKRIYYQTHTEPTQEIAEHYFPERAHNEFLQIVDELGVVGMLLFAGVFVTFLLLILRNMPASRYRLSPMLWAGLAGMLAFFGSSFVSSFSFRIMQNGMFFFLVFAIAVNEAVKMRRKNVVGPAWPRRLFPGLLASTAVAVVLLGMRGYADLQVRKADGSSRLAQAMPYYRSAIFFDPDNFFVLHRIGVRYGSEGQYLAGAASIRKMIDDGGGTVLNYAVMAEYLESGGQTKNARDALDEAIATYSNSVFMRVRYAVYLEEHGDQAAADLNFERARLLNAKQANGWYMLLKGTPPKGMGPNDETDIADELRPTDARIYYQAKRKQDKNSPVQRYTY